MTTGQATRKVEPQSLPEHVASGDEWKAWPRKIEAHVVYGARERQVTALCRSGRIVVWRCPDDSLRLDPSSLEEHFGKPGVFVGRDRQPADEVERDKRASRAKAAELDVSDPLPGLVRELTSIVKEMRQEKSDLLKLLLDPMSFGITFVQKLADRALDRVSELEEREIENRILFEELISMKQARDLESSAEAAKQKRRDELMGLLKSRLPSVLDPAFGIGSLASFVKGLTPMQLEAVKGLLEAGLLDEKQAATLRRALGLDDKSHLNGKSHGTASASTETAGGMQ